MYDEQKRGFPWLGLAALIAFAALAYAGYFFYHKYVVPLDGIAPAERQPADLRPGKSAGSIPLVSGEGFE